MLTNTNHYQLMGTHFAVFQCTRCCSLAAQGWQEVRSSCNLGEIWWVKLLHQSCSLLLSGRTASVHWSRLEIRNKEIKLKSHIMFPPCLIHCPVCFECGEEVIWISRCEKCFLRVVVGWVGDGVVVAMNCSKDNLWNAGVPRLRPHL